MGMSAAKAVITGIGSVSALGALRGLVVPRQVEPGVVTGWPTNGQRRAYLVEPFRAGDVVPGLKTRRLDRLSVWSLVATSLALQDAHLDLQTEDRSRAAVVFGTGLGCLELTEAFFQSMAENGCAKADPIIFPETLCSSPASHVARVLGLRGPNITASCKGISGEAALLQAASLLGSGEADLAVALAGDTLTRTLYEWCDAASVGFVPGEGLAAVILEAGHRRLDRGARVYAAWRSGFMATDPQATDTSWGSGCGLTVELIRKALGDSPPSEVKLVISSANGSPGLDRLEAQAIAEVFGASGAPDIATPKAVSGEFDGSGILRLVLALSGMGTRQPRHRLQNGLTLLLGAAAGGGRAVLSLEAA